MGEAQLDLLERLLVRLEAYAGTVSLEALATDLDTLLKVSRALELVAQCCVDLGMELVAKRGLGVPETYRDVFSRLAQDGVISAEACTALQSWAGLRNVLAHMYTELDLGRLHAAMGEVAMLRAFARIAARELGRGA
jgi:uncharacterized protein YutE (UPF0331/DUF86 family)